VVVVGCSFEVDEVVEVVAVEVVVGPAVALLDAVKATTVLAVGTTRRPAAIPGVGK
jgi:hypothetical protein